MIQCLLVSVNMLLLFIWLLTRELIREPTVRIAFEILLPLPSTAIVLVLIVILSLPYSGEMMMQWLTSVLAGFCRVMTRLLIRLLVAVLISETLSAMVLACFAALKLKAIVLMLVRLLPPYSGDLTI